MAYIIFDNNQKRALALYHSSWGSAQPPEGCMALWCKENANVNDHAHWLEVAANPERHTPPEDYEEDLYDIAWVDGMWQTSRKADDNVRNIMMQRVNAQRDKIFSSGVSFDFGGQVYTLQTRGTEDLLNWTGLANKASKMPVATPLTIRTAENATLTLPAGSLVYLILTGIGRREQVLAASWQLKDAIKDADSIDAAYDAYEGGIDSVWPDNTPIPVQVSEPPGQKDESGDENNDPPVDEDNEKEPENGEGE